MSHVLLRVGAAVVLLLALATRGEAESPRRATAPTTVHKALAKLLVNAGRAAFDEKDYREAVELYRKAYALIPHPILLFNIGQAQRLRGQLDDAAWSYEGYLAADPNGVEAAPARALLANLDPARRSARAAATRPAPARTTDETAPAPAVRSMPVVAVLPASKGSAPSASSSPVQRDTPARPGRALRIAGIAAGGVGLACAGTALAFGLRVDSIRKEQITERYDKDLPYEADRLRVGRVAERNQYIAAAIAAPLIVGGAALYWVGHRQGRATATTAWLPMIGPGMAGIAMIGALP